MNIEQDYLANIFKSDLLFVLENNEDSLIYQEEKSPNEGVAPQFASQPEENKKPDITVLILVEGDLHLKEKDTLRKLLKAINVEEGQYEIIKEHPEKLQSVQHLKLFLSFHNQYVRAQEYSIMKINKGNAIYAHDLAELNQDTTKKLMLWNLLKTIV